MLANRLRQAQGGGLPNFTFTLGAGIDNYNLANDLVNRGWNGIDTDIVVRVTVDEIIGSTNPNAPAFDIPVSLDGADIEIVFNADLEGGPGTQGAGGSNAGGNGGAGQRGGTALRARAAVTIDNQAAFKGGGGGGGGGGGVRAGLIQIIGDDSGGDPTCTEAGATGGPGGPGQGHGSAAQSGTNGSNTSGACLATSGKGGNGGNFGAAAGSSNAAVNSSCDCNITLGSGGAAGPAGYAVDGVSNVTWTNMGTLTGPTTG